MRGWKLPGVGEGAAELVAAGARGVRRLAAMTEVWSCGLDARLAALSAQKATASCEPKERLSSGRKTLAAFCRISIGYKLYTYIT